MCNAPAPPYFQWEVPRSTQRQLSHSWNIADVQATAQWLFSGAAERRKLPWVGQSKMSPTSKKLKHNPSHKRYSTGISEEPTHHEAQISNLRVRSAISPSTIGLPPDHTKPPRQKQTQLTRDFPDRPLGRFAFEFPAFAFSFPFRFLISCAKYHSCPSRSTAPNCRRP